MLLKPLCPRKHHRAPIPHVSCTDETSGLFARSGTPAESSCSVSRTGRLSVTLRPESLDDVQGGSFLPIRRICEAAGLEAAVTSWWRGPRRSARRNSKAERKEDVWLRSAVLSGASEKVRQKLARSGIPETVIDGGFQLGHFIAEDPEMQQAYASHLKEATERAGEASHIFWESQHRSNPRVEFVGHAVSEILRRYDLIYQAPLPSDESTSFQTASLTLSARPPSTRPPNKVAGNRRPKPSLEPSCQIKQAGISPTMPRPGWEPLRSAEEDTLRNPVPTRPSIPSPEQEDDDIGGPPAAVSKTSSSVMTSDLEVTAVTDLAKTLKLSDDTGDERSSTTTPRLGFRSSVSSSQGRPVTPLEARKYRPRGSSQASSTPTQLPSTTSTPHSALPSSSLGGRSISADFSAHLETPRLTQSNTLRLTQVLSNIPHLSQTSPGSFPPYRRASLSSTGAKRKIRTSSFEQWNERAREVSDEKQTIERLATTKEMETAVHSEGHGKPRQTIFQGRKGFKNLTRDHGELRRIYASFDKDGSGVIEPDEFMPLLAKLLKQPAETLNKQEVWRNWDEMDADGSGTITYDEFLKWYCATFDVDINPDRSTFISEADVDVAQKMIREISMQMNMDVLKLEKLYAEFKKLDGDNSGTLEFGEFKVLVQGELSPTGDPVVPDKVMNKFWIDIDTDGSGGVSFGEFVTWYMKFFYGAKSPMEQYYDILGKRAS
eukprot:TRINITY_DN31847_c0_g1_i1.p1 TRINITY_DN31847_c0_g1~~TRINITY_DN31847_c0_g1_i1.p1  ORF type:complete len:717 (+),score=107.86 TRINITY_DN31847_c0_g1_i1:120-2270(+)